MPLYRKLPRRGFNNYNFRTSYQLVNLAELNKIEGDVVNRSVLIEAGLIRENKQGIKILGDGKVEKAFTFEVDKVSASARAKIEEAGGKVVITNVKAKLTETEADSE
jgi:large subunit ribosomal protein L15